MMSRNAAPSSYALQQRHAFLQKYGKEAFGVLEQLDHQIKNAPEEGWAIPDHRDVIMLNMKIPLKDKFILCQVAYTYNDETFSWKEFYYEEIPSA